MTKTREQTMLIVGDVFVLRDDPPSVFKHVKDLMRSADFLLGNLEGSACDVGKAVDKLGAEAWKADSRQLAAIEAGQAEPVLRVGNLEVTRDISDVRDIVAGYAALLERATSGEVYNLCRGEGVPLRQLVGDLAAMARVHVRIEVDPARLRPADMPWLVGDASRIRQATGWRTERPLRATLADVLDDQRARLRG